ncbi:MAG: hypothetical protein KDA79_10410 [Planctomycetaceae bacterium]|nr:hypothetical protein [Planctomycetaceae bacterium]
MTPEPDWQALTDLDARVVWFPVRHHSPTCARLVTKLIRQMRPAVTLIEGPSDFNDRIDELFLGHDLPIAIYSYTRRSDGQRRGAYYPYCSYSPEWQAIQTSREQEAAVRFIDLPWAEMASLDDASHRYADAELRRGRYVRQLCERFGVEDFDDLWDRLVETQPDLSLADYLERVHQFCGHVRLWEEEISQSDLRREAFMAAGIERALEEFEGRVLVVTGGFHSSALCDWLNGRQEADSTEPAEVDAEPEPMPVERGIALTPYSYEQLDSLSGYNAGMPSPGFYHQVWHDRKQGGEFSYRPLLARVAQALRKRKQVVSTADLIAVETMARALASLRGRTTVWRRDLLDAVTGALVKEELEYGCDSPFLEEVLRVFRGRRRGRLADGAQLPPLVENIRQLLAEHDLVPGRKCERELNLLEPGDLAKSRVLHRLRILEIGGFRRIDGTDFAVRDDLVRLWELWQIGWTPNYDASSIEASRYGTTLDEAATARLVERATGDSHTADELAGILLDAAFAGVEVLTPELIDRLEQQIHQHGEFAAVAGTLRHLLFLYSYDEALGTAGSSQLGQLLREAFTRAAWLLEGLGQSGGQDQQLIEGIRVLVETFELTEHMLDLNREEFLGVLSRVEADHDQLPSIRGAAVGGLWSLHAADTEQVLADLLLFSDVDHLGDFLTGLFHLAREVAQRNPQLVRNIDELLLSFSGDDFLQALPSLRLSFTSFTPREKHHMLTTLFDSLGIREMQPLHALEVDSATAAEALAFEDRLYRTLRKYGIRGADQ